MSECVNSVFTLVFIVVKITSKGPLVIYILSLLFLSVLELVSLSIGSSLDTTAPSIHLYVTFALSTDPNSCLRGYLLTPRIRLYTTFRSDLLSLLGGLVR